MSENQVQLSLGESRVRTQFNPSLEGLVDQIKQKTAELINLVNSIHNANYDPLQNAEMARIRALAMTEYESAAHWAVKTATFGL